MIKIEQDRQERSERYREENVISANIPEVHHPSSINSGKECIGSRQSLDKDIFHVSVVDEAGEEDDGQRGTIVFDELADPTLEKATVSNYPTHVAAH